MCISNPALAAGISAGRFTQYVDGLAEHILEVEHFHENRGDRGQRCCDQHAESPQEHAKEDLSGNDQEANRFQYTGKCP